MLLTKISTIIFKAKSIYDLVIKKKLLVLKTGTKTFSLEIRLQDKGLQRNQIFVTMMRLGLINTLLQGVSIVVEVPGSWVRFPV